MKTTSRKAKTTVQQIWMLCCNLKLSAAILKKFAPPQDDLAQYLVELRLVI
jgi:hypothetical protein